jgi:hypothetical protein
MVDGRTRALLDTNIWRYVVDGKAQGALIRAARNGSYGVQIAPGVLYETLRLNDVPLRASLVHLMTNPCFHRLMPEAYSESMEILREIERVRPDWLHESPDLRFFNRLIKDWTRKTGGFWVRCERSPESEAKYVSQLEGPLMENAKSQAQMSRKEMIDSGWKSNPPMDQTLGGFSFPVPGWRGDMVEGWRIDSLLSMTHGLAQQGPAYRDSRLLNSEKYALVGSGSFCPPTSATSQKQPVFEGRRFRARPSIKPPFSDKNRRRAILDCAGRPLFVQVRFATVASTVSVGSTPACS